MHWVRPPALGASTWSSAATPTAVLGGVFGGDLGLFSPYLHGMCRKDGLTMAVTSGLGSQRERLPRFHNPPEIMVIDLTPES